MGRICCQGRIASISTPRHHLQIDTKSPSIRFTNETNKWIHSSVNLSCFPSGQNTSILRCFSVNIDSLLQWFLVSVVMSITMHAYAHLTYHMLNDWIRFVQQHRNSLSFLWSSVRFATNVMWLHRIKRSDLPISKIDKLRFPLSTKLKFDWKGRTQELQLFLIWNSIQRILEWNSMRLFILTFTRCRVLYTIAFMLLCLDWFRRANMFRHVFPHSIRWRNIKFVVRAASYDVCA